MSTPSTPPPGEATPASAGTSPDHGATGSATSLETPLRRAVGRNLLLLFIVGDVLGGGIYALAGEIGAEVGGAIWAPMIVALVLGAFTAASYAELVTKYPQAAGAALYANRAFRRPFFTFMVAFAVMASGITSAATLSRGFAENYFTELVDVPVLLVVLAFLVVVSAINIRGIKESVRVNAALSVIEVGGLVLVVVVAVAALASGVGDLGAAFTVEPPEVDGTAKALLPAILAATAIAFYAVIGFEDSVNIAEEAEDPRRDYPRALFLGLGIAGAFYVVIGLLAPAVLSQEVLLDYEERTTLIEMAQVGPLGVPATVFTVIGLFALANGALINLVMASRLTYGMSRQGIIPRAFGVVLKSRRTPLTAILFTTALCVLLASIGELGELGGTTATLLLLVFAVVNTAVLRLRRDPGLEGHFRTPTPLPIVGAVASAGLAVYTLVTEPVQLAFVGGILGVGVLFWVGNVVAKRQEGTSFDTGAIQRMEDPDDLA